MPSAGSLATYAARGIHPSVGFLVAWAYVLVGWLIPPLVLLQLGFTVDGTLHSEFSGYTANLWWVWSIIGALIILAAGFYGIRTSARLGTVLGVFEIGVFLVLAIFLVVHAGSNNTLSVFTTKYTTTGFHGISGVIAGSVFTILAFGGFEGAAPLAEEARNPRRTIQRAVLLSTVLIGALYVFTTYAIDVAFGPAQFHNFTTGASPTASWVGVARSLYGIFWFFVFLAIVNSTIANANAGVNVSSRTAYAMGRIRAFPAFLAHINARHRSPVYSHPDRVRDHDRGHARAGPQIHGAGRVRDDGHRHRDLARGDLHPDERGLHRILRPQAHRLQRAVPPDHPAAGRRRVRARLAERGGGIPAFNFITPLSTPYSYMGRPWPYGWSSA